MPNNEEKNNLIAELKKRGVKHTPENIIKIAQKSDGKIVFLETGDESSGLTHILKIHKAEFADIGILEDHVPDAIINAVLDGKIVGDQGKRKDRPIYEITLNNQIKHIAVTVSNNGYIVCANPRPIDLEKME